MSEKLQIRQTKYLIIIQKNPRRTNYLFEGSESYRVFNYLPDSNSNFRPARSNSDLVLARTVRVGSS